MQGLMGVLWKGLQRWIALRGLLDAPMVPSDDEGETRFNALFGHPELKFLHVGCGQNYKTNAGLGFQDEKWHEIRLDIDPSVAPDIVCSMMDMHPVPDASVDAVYSADNIEHLYPHEVSLAFSEFIRVLKPDGLLVLTCPDLQTIAGLILDGKLLDTAYVSPSGPITALDMLYGYRPALARGNLFMAHHTGFTQQTLIDAARSSGFRSVAVRRRKNGVSLWMVAAKALLPESEVHRLAELHLPT